MADYIQTITCPVTVKRAYQAITQDMSDWWTPMSAPFLQVGDQAKTAFGGDSYWVFKAIALNEPDKVKLECIESQMLVDSLDDPEEWLGTVLSFDISESAGSTQIEFTHFGLKPEIQCYGVCSAGWDHYILGSLRDYLQGGQGQPNSY